MSTFEYNKYFYLFSLSCGSLWFSKTDTCIMSNSLFQILSPQQPSFFFFQFLSPQFQLQIACRAPSILLIFSIHLLAALLPYLALQQSLAQLSFLYVRTGENRGAKVVMEQEKTVPTKRLTRTQMFRTNLSLLQTAALTQCL